VEVEALGNPLVLYRRPFACADHFDRMRAVALALPPSIATFRHVLDLAITSCTCRRPLPTSSTSASLSLSHAELAFRSLLEPLLGRGALCCIRRVVGCGASLVDVFCRLCPLRLNGGQAVAPEFEAVVLEWMRLRWEMSDRAQMDGRGGRR
jgi:hypothetical protein